MHSLERTLIEITETKANLNKFTKERLSLVEIVTKAKGLMAAIVIEAKKQALIVDEDEL
jgi:hypothetical protein